MNFKRDNRIIEEMMEELGNIDMGNVTGDWQVASMDREMKQKNMSPEERHGEIMKAYDITPAFELMEQLFPPVNDLRDDTTGTEPSRNHFKEGLKFTVNSSEQGFNMHQREIQQRDTARVVDSGGRSPGER
ncbi:MAG: hypothetical protein K6D97_06900 [Clostridia bacterium]|nr:hypothetical protein [Clostridia bacterium]